MSVCQMFFDEKAWSQPTFAALKVCTTVVRASFDSRQPSNRDNETVAALSVGPGVNFIKIFSLSLTTRPNKLEGLPLETFSSRVLEF